MRLKTLKLVLFVCAAVAAIGAAIWTRSNLLFLAGFAVFAIVMIRFAIASLRDDGGESALNDPAVSTLVFPPESRFEQSVLPKR